MNYSFIFTHQFFIMACTAVLQINLKKYDSILERLVKPNKLVFDITKILHHKSGMLNHSRSFADNLDLHLPWSQNLYYGGDVGAGAGKDLPKRIMDKDYASLPPLSFIFSSQLKYSKLFNPDSLFTVQAIPFSAYYFNKSTGDEDLFTPVFNCRSWNFPITKAIGSRMEELVKAFKIRSGSGSPKVGIELGNVRTRKIYRRLTENKLLMYAPIFGVMGKMDVIVLNIEIPFEDFTLSYSQFKETLREVIDWIYNSIRLGTLGRKIYAKINLLRSKVSEPNSELLYEKYVQYLIHYAVLWTNDREKEELILDMCGTGNPSVAEPETLNGADWNELFVMSIFPLRDQTQSAVVPNICHIKSVMDHATMLNVKGVALNARELEWIQNDDKCVLTNDKACNEIKIESSVCNRPSGPTIQVGIYLKYAVQQQIPSDLENELVNISKTMIGLNWESIEFDFSERNQTSSGVNWDSFSSLGSRISRSLPPNVMISCTLHYDYLKAYNPEQYELANRYLKSMLNNCKPILNQTKLLIVHVVLVDAVRSPYSTAPILDELAMMLQALSKLAPEKLLMVRTTVDLNGWATLGLYCQKEITVFHEISEMLFQFFGMRRIPFEMSWTTAPLPRTLEQYVGWSIVKPIEELNPATTKFPVFVARNHPPNFLLGEAHSDPCIPWREDVPISGIQMEPHYGGTTLYIGDMRNETISTGELETLLLFTFHKFSLVELIPINVTDLETIFQVLSREDFFNQLVFQGKDSTGLKLYLRIDCKFFHEGGSMLDRYLLEKLKPLKLKLIGVHFVDWASCLDIPHWNQMNLTGINSGISLEDCLSEVNNDFGNLHDFDFYEFSQVDYLLCNIKIPVNPTEIMNKEKAAIEAYLDSSLYIQRYFQRHFPNLNMEIMFRLNVAGKRSSAENFSTPVPSKSSDVFYFLRLFSDVAQYARLYKIKFFMFSAFDDEWNSRFGWWRILQFEDLSNYSVFIEKEAEHFGRESWTPTVEEEKVLNLAKLIIFGMGEAIAILVTAFFVLYIRYRRRFALLTKAEVDDFWRGGSSSAENSEENQSNKFPFEFVIPKSRIILLELIGKGNFGLVYDATLLHPEGGGSDSVAVKIPLPDSSKESFKAMLSELKLLCYVGHHPHVLQFVGAYVQQIGRGILYIVTELCENGALQNYLRKLDQEIKEDLEEGVNPKNLNFYELCRFAHEIAQGMVYITSKQIVHGDLATRNVLLDRNFSCKIADFGLSTKCCEGQDSVKIEMERCPWRWMAVESLQTMELNIKSDVWSYGVTLWEIFTLGCIPYSGMSWTVEFTEALQNGMRLTSPQFSSVEIYETMQRCWDNDPDRRPDFENLSQHFADELNKEYTEL